jgi:uncharacterized protein (DUF1015 family)
MYDDPKKTISKLLAKATKGTPLAALTDDAGEGHALWAMTDPATVTKVMAALAPGKLYIADGHHRYETALAYRDEVAELHRGLVADDAANFVLMALVAMNDPGLVVLPTHRLLKNLPNAALTDLPHALGRFWVPETIGGTADEMVARLAAAGTDGSAAVVATRDHTWLLRIAPAGQERLRASGESPAWQSLDVAAVHELIVDAALGIPRDAVATSDAISFTRDAVQALATVQAGSAQVAILLNPTRPEQVRDVAETGGRMPQKSTFFYPKLITGLVINPVW